MRNDIQSDVCEEGGREKVMVFQIAYGSRGGGGGGGGRGSVPNKYISITYIYVIQGRLLNYFCTIRKENVLQVERKTLSRQPLWKASVLPLNLVK